jgi:hypothetical protein
MLFKTGLTALPVKISQEDLVSRNLDLIGERLYYQLAEKYNLQPIPMWQHISSKVRKIIIIQFLEKSSDEQR